MNTESEILKLRDQIVSAASAYYYAVKDTLKKSGYSISYIYEQRDSIRGTFVILFENMTICRKLIAKSY